MNPRNIFIALLVLNVLVFAWANWIDTEPKLPRAATAAITQPGAAAVPPEAVAVSAPVALADALPAPARCVSVGPFRDTTETTQAIDAFRAAGYEPRSRAQAAQISDGFWVHVDAIKSSAEQSRVLAAIKRAGIEDAYAMPDGEPRYVVSVGIFSDRERAERRAQRVRALKIDAQVDPHSRSTTFYWLDMPERPGDQTLRLDVLNGSGAPPGGLTITACPAATSAPG